jgi:hypothetical protein
VEQLAHELFEAVGALHMALRMHLPVHNTWRPRLMSLGTAFLEYMAAKSTGGHALGMAHAARVAVEANQRELAAAIALQAPLQRVLAASARATTLADGEVREAALKLAQVAAESGEAYAQDNLWRPTKAKAARENADAALYAALDELLTVVRAHLTRAETPRRFWRPRPRRRSVAQSPGTAINAALPRPRLGDATTPPTRTSSTGTPAP